MPRFGPCLCGDTECPSCGPLQGNSEAGEGGYEGPENCDCCGKVLPRGHKDWLCPSCDKQLEAIKRTKEWKYPYARED